MLQRNMDSSADYGTPLVLSKKGWIKETFKRNTIAEKIPVITSKISGNNGIWSKLKYFARIEPPIQIAGIVIFGTLLGAAYAVTVQTDNTQNRERAEAQPLIPQEPIINNIQVKDELVASKSELLKESIMPIDVSIFDTDLSIVEEAQEVAETQESTNIAIVKIPTDVTITSEKAVAPVVIALNEASSNKSFKISHPKAFNAPDKPLDEKSYSSIIIPKELIPDVIEPEEPTMSEYEQKTIRELEKKLALTQQKIEKVDMINLKLQGKFETLVVKNRALSDQLRHIDNVTASLKGR